MSTALAIRRELLDALPGLLRDVPMPAKVIARRVGATPRAVEGHRQSEHLPTADILLAYAREFPDVRDLVLRLIDVQASAEPMSERELTELITRIVRAQAKGMG